MLLNPLQAKRYGNLVPQLRAFLKEKLPYMVPSAFVVLDTCRSRPAARIVSASCTPPSQAYLKEAFVAVPWLRNNWHRSGRFWKSNKWGYMTTSLVGDILY